MQIRFVIPVILLVASSLANAQSAPAGKTPEQLAAELKWLKPGEVGRIGDKAEFKVQEGYSFLDNKDTDTFLKLNGNLPPGNAYTIASEKNRWFGVLSFSDDGYIKDDEKIDADALLKTLKERNVAGNEEKRKQGVPTLTLEGWYFAPRYDTESKRLEWGTRLRAQDNNQEVVNVSTKILGRSGYMNAVLVTEPATLDRDLADFKVALKNFDYVSGEKYSEWKQGDKVAAFGLGALVLGGAAAVATSKGGFKMVFLAIAAGAAALWGGFKKFFGRK
ncbi:MAG: DUF2167 domain-containing protein [Rhizobacter sp.]|nr:DUF2167 domain-containing protein [Rhizobacter sp.]